MASGRFLAPYDLRHRQRVAVLGSETAMELFSTTQVSGKMLRLGKEWFTVIGVLGTDKLAVMKLSGFQSPDTGHSIYSNDSDDAQSR